MSYIVYDTQTWQPVQAGFNAAQIRFVPSAIRISENDPQTIQDRMPAYLLNLSFGFADITRYANEHGYNFLAIQTNVGRSMEFDVEIPETLGNIRSNPPLAASSYITNENGQRQYHLDFGFNFCFLN